MALGLNITNHTLEEDIISGVDCNWIAAHNPIVMEFQRWDFEITNIYLSGSDVWVVGNAGTVFQNSITVGDFVYLKTALYDGTYEVTYVLNDNMVLTLTDYTADEGTGATVIGYIYAAVNLVRLAYYVNCKLYKEQPASVLKNTFKVYLDSKGYGFIDLKTYCKVYLSQLSTLILGVPANDKDAAASCKFKFSYAEVYTGNTPSYSDILFFAINGAKQYGDEYGSNYGEYFTYKTGGDDSERAKLLTDFDTLRIWDGFPIDLSYIYSSEGSFQPYLTVVEVDQAGNTLATTAADQGTTTRDYVNRATLLKNWNALTDHGTIRLMTNKGVSPVEYYSASLPFDYIRCVENLFYIRWRNLLGGWNYWGFDKGQDLEITGELSQLISQYQWDLANSLGSKRAIGRTRGRIITVTDTMLTQNQMYALSRMPGTVQWYFSEDTHGMESRGDYWLNINVVNNSTKYGNKYPVSDIELSFELPEILSQRY
jgi:hypothetical protein